jgi:Domain of unknown function (DUF2382)
MPQVTEAYEFFGAKHTFIPLVQVDHRRGEVVVPYSKEQVKDAPSVDPDGQLPRDEEDRLYSHYGLGGSEQPVGHDVSGPTTDHAMTRNVDQALDGPEISEEEHEVVLHEEEPVVEKRVVPKERVRMGKDTRTDDAQVSEEVRKEQIEADGDVGRT